MTQVKVDEMMNPGRELDALVAEKVMGWHHDPTEPISRYWFDENGEYSSLRDYSTDIAAAWEVVEKAGLLKKYLLYQFDNGWVLQDHSERPFCEGLTAPHAICLAALKALGCNLPTDPPRD